VKLIDGDAAEFWHAGATGTEVLGDKWHRTAPHCPIGRIYCLRSVSSVRKHAKVLS
jgi:hypothetical protein